MATVQTHAQNIIRLAADADKLIGELRTVLQNIQAEENALHLQSVKSGPRVVGEISGRRRLANYAKEQVFGPQHPQTVTELATAAWSEFSR